MKSKRKLDINLGIALGTHPLVGVAALPFLEFLQNQELFTLRKIIGSGQGALSAALIACGRSNREIQETLLEFCRGKFYQAVNYKAALKMCRVGGEVYHPEQSFFKAEEKSVFFDKVFGEEKVNKQKIGLELLATDISTAEPYIIKNGPISKAVYGASAWFPFHPPVRHQGRLLVNGGFSEAIPSIDDETLDVQVIINLRDIHAWQHASKPSEGWAFFERAFQVIEASKKQEIRKKGDMNLVPVDVELDIPIPFEGISQEHLNHIYNISYKEVDFLIQTRFASSRHES